MHTQILEVHNKIDLLEATSAADAAEDSGSCEDSAFSEEMEPAPDACAAPDDAVAAEAPPAASWAESQLQQHMPTGGREQHLHQPSAAAAPEQQQTRVNVSAVTGAGLGLLLQEIDRKVRLEADPFRPLSADN